MVAGLPVDVARLSRETRLSEPLEERARDP